MSKFLAGLCLVVGLAATAAAAEPEDYKGPFPTTALYRMCSATDAVSREKCSLYLQGLVYGVRVQRQMSEKGMGVCLPETDAEQARRKVVGFIDGVTGGRPANNKDAGDWIAFMALAQGNLCGKARR